MDSTLITVLITLGAIIASSVITWIVSRHFYSRSKLDSEDVLQGLAQSLKKVLDVTTSVGAAREITSLETHAAFMEKIKDMITRYSIDSPIGGIELIIADLHKVLESLEIYRHMRVGRGD